MRLETVRRRKGFGAVLVDAVALIWLFAAVSSADGLEIVIIRRFLSKFHDFTYLKCVFKWCDAVKAFWHSEHLKMFIIECELKCVKLVSARQLTCKVDRPNVYGNVSSGPIESWRIYCSVNSWRFRRCAVWDELVVDIVCWKLFRSHFPCTQMVWSEDYVQEIITHANSISKSQLTFVCTRTWIFNEYDVKNALPQPSSLHWNRNSPLCVFKCVRRLPTVLYDREHSS